MPDDAEFVFQPADVGDWRKNIEDKADRKKMFETS